MLTGLIILEDSQIKFTLHDAHNASVTVCDGATGEMQEIECSTAELAASLALGVAGDDSADERFNSLVSDLYVIAESLQARLSPNLRMIP